MLYMTLHLPNIDAIRNDNFGTEIVGKVDLNTAPNKRAGNLAECQMKGFVCKLAHIGIFALNLKRCGTDWDSFCKIRNNRLAMSKSKYVQYLTGDGVTFYTPVWKTGRIMPWLCPSARPSFPDFFSTCFEISTWNLVYAYSWWHDMSSLSFITIGSLWPSLQPKVGQTQFLQSWPYKIKVNSSNLVHRWPAVYFST